MSIASNLQILARNNIERQFQVLNVAQVFTKKVQSFAFFSADNWEGIILNFLSYLLSGFSFQPVAEKKNNFWSLQTWVFFET